MIVTAFKNVLRKRYGLVVVVMCWQIAFLVWREGYSHYLDILQLMAISALASTVMISLIGVPLEYSRLKRQPAGLYVSDHE